jgi:hypothetical protein
VKNYDIQSSVRLEIAANNVVDRLDILDALDALTADTLQQQPIQRITENDNILATLNQYENKTQATAQSIGLNRQQAFSCLVLFDSGNVNLHPTALSKVMAMSSGNSICGISAVM